MSGAITKEAIKHEIENVPKEKLETLYRFIKDLANSQPKAKSDETFMAKMRKIKIDAPPDFSRNIDLYMTGEKTIE